VGILEGKRILVTGLTARNSIAFRVAQIAQQEGATIMVSNFGRAMRMTRRSCMGLDPRPPLLELDVTKKEDLERVADEVEKNLGGLDGVVHAIAYANPFQAMGGLFMQTPWESVDESLEISAYSLVALARACLPVLHEGSAIVGLSFESRVSWHAYDWMGVSKATLEAISRYLARFVGPLGIRSNIISSGPLDTLSKNAIPLKNHEDEKWNLRAPIAWDVHDTTATALATVALLSDFFPSTTGEVIHVDGGFHSAGM